MSSSSWWSPGPLPTDHNLHRGTVGVLCLAPDGGLGVGDEALRAEHLHRFNAFRGQ